MTIKLSATRTANVPKDVLWSVIDDYQNIANHTSQVKVSTLTSDNETGLGAVRQCDLAPMGKTVETITSYTPGEVMQLDVRPKGLPVKSSLSTFTVSAIDANTSQVSVTAEVETKGGFMKGFIEKRLEKRLPKGFESLLDDLVKSAEASVTST